MEAMLSGHPAVLSILTEHRIMPEFVNVTGAVSLSKDL